MSKSIWMMVGMAVLVLSLSTCNRKTAALSQQPTKIKTDESTAAPKKDLTMATSSKEDRMAARTSTRDVSKMVNKVAPKPIINFKRTPCYGKCPVYELVVSSDGALQYEGKRFVQYEGSYKAQLPDQALDALMKKIEEVKFFDLNSSYPAENEIIPDLPNAIMTITLQDREHMVTNNHNAPQALLELEAELDRLIKEVKWVEVK